MQKGDVGMSRDEQDFIIEILAIQQPCKVKGSPRLIRDKHKSAHTSYWCENMV